MLPEERMSKIMGILNEQGSATVEQLAERLQVSEMTIRRDLEKCKRFGNLHRCYGGVMLHSEVIGEQSYEQKELENRQVKQQLATACASLISPGSAIYLDAGTTTYCIAEQIWQIPELTILTNDLNIALFTSRHKVSTVVMGGAVQSSTCSMVGSMTYEQLNNIHVSAAFVGAMSINEQFDTMTPTLEKAFLKRILLDCANECFLVADASKFHRQGLHRINNLSDYTAVVTNAHFTDAEEKIIRQKQIKILYVET